MAPVYDFRCPEGHVTESRQGREIEAIFCPCGEAASRLSVYHFGIGGVPPTRYRVSEFQEAAQEANYYHGRMEEAVQDTIPRIDDVKAAKRKARSLGAKVR